MSSPICFLGHLVSNRICKARKQVLTVSSESKDVGQQRDSMQIPIKTNGTDKILLNVIQASFQIFWASKDIFISSYIFIYFKVCLYIDGQMKSLKYVVN